MNLLPDISLSEFRLDLCPWAHERLKGTISIPNTLEGRLYVYPQGLAASYHRGVRKELTFSPQECESDLILFVTGDVRWHAADLTKARLAVFVYWTGSLDSVDHDHPPEVGDCTVVGDFSGRLYEDRPVRA